MNLGRTSGELGGTRKLIQDFLAPELGAIKATLVAFQESTKAQFAQLQENQRENFALLHDTMKASEARTTLSLTLMREEAKAQEQRTLRAIETSSTELKLLIRATDAERRNAELERQLAEARAHGHPPQQ